ncbi:hypothetical protein ABIA32_002179 [Streptacidiphilus sp. MAP12-20]
MAVFHVRFGTRCTHLVTPELRDIAHRRVIKQKSHLVISIAESDG